MLPIVLIILLELQQLHLWSDCTCSSGLYVSSTKKHSQNDRKFQAGRYSTSPLLLCSTLKKKKSQLYQYLIQIGGVLQIFYLLDGSTVTEITHLPRWSLPAALLYISRMLNLLKLGVCLQKRIISGEARFFEPFTFSMLLGKITCINNTHLSSLCNIISLIESCHLFSGKSQSVLLFYWSFIILFWKSSCCLLPFVLPILTELIKSLPLLDSFALYSINYENTAILQCSFKPESCLGLFKFAFIQILLILVSLPRPF